MTEKGINVFRKALNTEMLLYILLVVFIATRGDNASYLWDFKVYYFAAKAHSTGLNPYDNEVFKAFAGYNITPYPYTPITLWFFRLFSAFPLSTAKELYLLFSALLLAALLAIWRDGFLRDDFDELFYPFSIFSYGALMLSFVSGNVALLEFLLLWAGLYFYLKGRLVLFCTFVLLTASLKMLPIMFLALLFFSGDGRRNKLFAYSLMAFLTVNALSIIASPEFFRGYLDNLVLIPSYPSESSWNDANTFRLVGDSLGSLSHLGLQAPHWLKYAAYSCVLAFVWYVSWKVCLGLMKTNTLADRSTLIYFLCVVYALSLPRFKDYSYILLILPTYFIIRRQSYRRFYLLMAGLSTGLFLRNLSLHRITLLTQHPSFSVMLGYLPLLLAYAVWLMYVKEARSKDVLKRPGKT